MKLILVGYPGSQKIVPATRYLVEKYMPYSKGFDVEFLNYTGPIEGWSEFVADHLSKIGDEMVIFALDDYLLSDYVHMGKYLDASLSFQDPEVVCVKLFDATPEEHDEYPVTTQYTIWRREFLVWLLRQIKTPWEFELAGSRIFEQTGKKCLMSPCIKYPTHSCLSKTWEGIRFDGVNPEDLEHIKELCGISSPEAAAS